MNKKHGKHKILCIVGARPNFIKIAPILEAFKKNELIVTKLIHTGQHFDMAMNEDIFQDLTIPTPDKSLDIKPGSHATVTAKIMLAFESILFREKPAAILVVGDVNSTLACAVVAAKEQIPVFHVEAGLRSFDRTMPEEINRVLIDQISTLLFTTEETAIHNLAREGITKGVHFVGNVMIDTLNKNLKHAISITKTLQQKIDKYAMLTLHRPANIDCREQLEDFLTMARDLSSIIPIVFPIHPRTRLAIEKFSLTRLLDFPALITLGPLGYLSFLGMLKNAELVLTDSGGVQEETTALNIPCLTLRSNTERPITVTEGTNIIVGADPLKIRQAFENVLAAKTKKNRIPRYWDGKTANRICNVIVQWFKEGAL